MVYGFGFMFFGFGFRFVIMDRGLRVRDKGHMDYGSGSRVWDLGFGVKG